MHRRGLRLVTKKAEERVGEIEDPPVGRRVIDGRTARRDRNRDLVLGAVIELFREHQLAPSVSEVARRSGVSLRSVYRYFDDFDALVRAAIDQHQTAIAPLRQIPDLGVGPLDERVVRRAMCEGVLEVFNRWPQLAFVKPQLTSVHARRDVAGV